MNQEQLAYAYDKPPNFDDTTSIHPAITPQSGLGHPWGDHDALRPDAAHAQTRLTRAPGHLRCHAGLCAGRIRREDAAQALVFKIDTRRVQGDFAYLECLPLFSDCTDAVPHYLPDIGYNHCLQRGHQGWKVILDLSRTDVPDLTVARQIQQRLPPAFPQSILSDFWRDPFLKAQ